jgi:hypothetical protein
LPSFVSAAAAGVNDRSPPCCHRGLAYHPFTDGQRYAILAVCPCGAAEEVRRGGDRSRPGRSLARPLLFPEGCVIAERTVLAEALHQLADAASRCDRFHAVLDVGGVRVELRVGPLVPEAKPDRPAEPYSEMEQEILARCSKKPSQVAFHLTVAHGHGYYWAQPR